MVKETYISDTVFNGVSEMSPSAHLPITIIIITIIQIIIIPIIMSIILIFSYWNVRGCGERDISDTQFLLCV